jgi:hypothetical protein
MSKFSTWCNCSQIETTGRIWHMKEKEETYCVEKQYSVSWRVSFVRLSNPARWLWITISTYTLPLKWSSSQLAHPCAWMVDNHNRQTHQGSVCGWTTECPRRCTCRHVCRQVRRPMSPAMLGRAACVWLYVHAAANVTSVDPCLRAASDAVPG